MLTASGFRRFVAEFSAERWFDLQCCAPHIPLYFGEYSYGTDIVNLALVTLCCQPSLLQENTPWITFSDRGAFFGTTPDHCIISTRYQKQIMINQALPGASVNQNILIEKLFLFLCVLCSKRGWSVTRAEMTEPVGWVVCELVLLGGDNCHTECEQKLPPSSPL